MKKIVFASMNTHKVEEVAKILQGIEVLSIREFCDSFDVDETGTTYEENALLKARAAFKICGCPVIADDSGINCEAMQGAPGVYSARFLGEGSSQKLKNDTILRVCHETNIYEASYTCVIAYIDEAGNEHLFRNDFHGKIADKAYGEGGFGYDPIFIPNGYDTTLGCISNEEKNKISHRRKALEAFLAFYQPAKIHVVLYEPEIPQNTGNIMRTCAAAGVELHLIEPLGFKLDEARMRRSGMDYIDQLDYHVYESWDAFIKQHPSNHYYFLTRYGKKAPSAFTYPLNKDVFFVLGKESTGIDKHILKDHLENCMRLPMKENARSLNLSNCAAIIVYEALRQREYHGLAAHEVLKGADFLEEFEYEK